MTPPPFVSAIIPVYNQKEILEQNYPSWLEQAYPKDRFELIVVDDGSTDGLENYVQEMSRLGPVCIKYFHQDHKGPSAARNLGVREARGEIVAFSDADCRLAADWILEISQGYADERVAGVGGTSRAMPTKSMVSQYCGYVRMNEWPVRSEGTIAYIITGNASFRKEYLTAVGGFDERYAWPGGEEPDLCYRLSQKGYIFKHNRRAIVYNPHKQNLVELLRTFFCYGMGDAFLVLTKFSRWDLVSVRGITWLYCFFKALLRSIFFFIMTFKYFIKFPFQIILYYGEGLSFLRALVYAFFECTKNLAFQYGCITGYMLGKFKGFRKRG